jgi:hypothetical protein
MYLLTYFIFEFLQQYSKFKNSHFDDEMTLVLFGSEQKGKKERCIIKTIQ